MKNILLITTMYPTPISKIETPVIHYFAKEWVKMGYKVKVFHQRSVFPILFYWAAALFKRIAIKIIGNDNVITKRNMTEYTFTTEGVDIFSLPIFKFIPHGKFTKKCINKQLKRIESFLETNNFVPEIIIGHFHNPQIELIARMKKKYPAVKTAIVLHEDPIMLSKTYGNKLMDYFSYIDKWGFRSIPQLQQFKKLYGNNPKTFMCLSGIPEEFVRNDRKEFVRPLKKFLYVGHLMERKYPVEVLKALKLVYVKNQFHLTYIGSGNKSEEIYSMITKLKLNENVSLLGQKSRQSIMNYLDETDCFVMISKNEVFGLVYLEAMARGCITIGSRNEGIDGIIIHGINGFLCEAGNSIELASIITHINSLTIEEINNISYNAIITAYQMTDSMVAKNYINSITSIP